MRKEIYIEYFNSIGAKQTLINNELRFGSKGSFALDTINNKWYCHETGKGGTGEYQFLVNYIGLDKKEAREQLYGNDNNKTLSLKSSKSFIPRHNQAQNTKQEEEKRLKTTEIIENITSSIEENSKQLEEYFLNRGIEKDIFKKESLFYLNSKEALAIPLRSDTQNKLVGWHLKKLDKTAKQRYVTYLQRWDKNFYFYTLNEHLNPKHIGICEGIETGLSILQLNKENPPLIYCTLSTSNMSKFTLEKKILQNLETITIYADNDTAGEKASKGLFNFLVQIKNLCQYNFKASIEKPEKQYNDFNDQLNNLLT